MKSIEVCRLIIMLLFVAVSASPSKAITAQQMLVNCTDVRAGPNEQLLRKNTYEVGECMGAFVAIQKLGTLTDSNRDPLLQICLPAEGTLFQLIEVFRNYVRVHPEILHKHFAVVALESLFKAFPCRGK